MKGSLWRHGDKVDQIEPGEWPERSGRARVLIEHPDPATVWAEAEGREPPHFAEQLLTGARIPQPQRIIAARAGQEVSGWVERE